ncbi:hypothetical protein [Arthrobacter mobilis]|uniref:Uncharacterized protein n=1 Tax=Arthrobacter mobilis TaxID=2724944 RepID=A0A7X6K5Z2_9MICC|nr:hypothetical protein [Arthrobacter mobilis]NKX54470.1 hypothetical protein [Arthrobacter mobilis]
MRLNSRLPASAAIAAGLLSLAAACGLVAEDGGGQGSEENAGSDSNQDSSNNRGSGESAPVETVGGPDDGTYVPPGPPAPAGPPAPEGAPVLGWLPVGPVGRDDPTWYLYLKSGNCEQVPEPNEPPDTVEDVAKLFCAAVTGDESAWAPAAEQLAGLSVTEDSDCWSRAAYPVLQSVVDFHQQNPGTPFQLAEGSGLACEPTFYDLDDDGSDNNGRNAAASVCGGTTMHMVGTLGGLPAGSIRSVTVDTKPEPATVPVEQVGPDFVFLAPPTAEEGVVSVSVADGDWLVTESVDLQYLGDPSTCPGFESPDPSPSVDPGEPDPGEPDPGEPDPGEPDPGEPDPGPSLPPSSPAAGSAP